MVGEAQQPRASTGWSQRARARFPRLTRMSRPVRTLWGEVSRVEVMDRSLALGDRFTEDLDALGFQTLEVRQPRHVFRPPGRSR